MNIFEKIIMVTSKNAMLVPIFIILQAAINTQDIKYFVILLICLIIKGFIDLKMNELFFMTRQ